MILKAATKVYTAYTLPIHHSLKRLIIRPLSIMSVKQLTAAEFFGMKQ